MHKPEARELGAAQMVGMNTHAPQESLDLWRAEVDRHVPRPVRKFMPVSFCVGLALLLLWVVFAGGAFQVKIDGAQYEQDVLGALLWGGLTLAIWPLAFVAWLSTRVPPLRQSRS